MEVQITDQRELGLWRSNLHSASAPLPHQFDQGMEVLSWALSPQSGPGMPFTQYDDQGLSTAVFNFEPSINMHLPGSASSMDILNAESYNYGEQGVQYPKKQNKRPRVEEGNEVLPFGMTTSSPSQTQSATSNAPRVSSEEHDSRRKKKARASQSSEEDEASKKARGRPRLDTKDVSAIDRRRTQIRNAQRAYRSRKETTILSLESQVQELKGNNEEMGNMFMNLYEFAVGKGILQREPEFAQHLTATTERFLSLRKSVGDESSKDDEAVAADRGRSRSEEQPLTSQVEPAKITETFATPPDMSSVWGYQISHTSSPPNEIHPVSQESQGLQPDTSNMQMIAQATPDNASFFDMMSAQDMQQYRAEVPTTATFSLPQDLPLPNSYTYTEKSFARRLHREACQKGYKLFCNKSSDLRRYQQVFSFTLKYSSEEAIKTRSEQVVFASTAKDSLQCWDQPFLHLGGAGTFYPTDKTDKEGMPKFNSGLSMGPFREDVISTQENFLANDMQTFLPDADFQGQFFDSNDVENYLRTRGIIINPDMQYIPVDLETLIDYEVSVTRSVTSSSQTFSPRTPRSSAPSLAAQDFDSLEFDFDAFNTGEALSTLPLRFAEDWDSEQFNIASPKAQEAFELTEPVVNAAPVQEHVDNVSSTMNTSQQRLISISVETLMQYIVAHMVCLGRSPGIKPADVEAAIWMAVKEAVSV